MAFFDELGKKISQAGQSAVQKGKELADIAKLNSSVSDEKRKIADNYREIGKLYFSLHGENPGVDFAAMVAAIHESESKIVEYKQQIKDIRGVVCCEKCGAEVSSNAAFCSACGAPMPVVKPVETQPEDSSSQAEAAAESGSAEQPDENVQGDMASGEAEAASGNVQTEAAAENVQAEAAPENDSTQTGI